MSGSAARKVRAGEGLCFLLVKRANFGYNHICMLCRTQTAQDIALFKSGSGPALSNGKPGFTMEPQMQAVFDCKDKTDLDYRIQIVKSRRKSFSVRIKDEETVLVNAPLYATGKEIDAFLQKHERWIAKHLRKMHEKEEVLKNLPKLSETELKHLVADAGRKIPKRVAYYAPLVGADYGKITIRKQRSRWGSCTAEGNLSFNALLMLAPEEVLDSVVVHELCHRLEMNHSDAFYENVYRVFPEYDKWNKWLKDHGDLLIARLPGKPGK